jgi:hypothetical protein
MKAQRYSTIALATCGTLLMAVGFYLSSCDQSYCPKTCVTWAHRFHRYGQNSLAC